MGGKSERICVEELTDVGVVPTAVIVAFTARVGCEQTLVTWARGVQVMELSAPQFGLDLIGVFCVILGILWALTVVVLPVIHRQRISPTKRWLIALMLPGVNCVHLFPLTSHALSQTQTSVIARPAPTSLNLRVGIFRNDYGSSNAHDAHSSDIHP
jgi:hypothetical protein